MLDSILINLLHLSGRQNKMRANIKIRVDKSSSNNGSLEKSLNYFFNIVVHGRSCMWRVSYVDTKTKVL